MRKLKEQAEDVLKDFSACVRHGECLAPRFVEQRLIRCIEEEDHGGIWHWATHTVGAIQGCDQQCPGEGPMGRLVEAIHGRLR